jgi:hypothetical protein
MYGKSKSFRSFVLVQKHILFFYLVFGFQGKENFTQKQMNKIKSCQLTTIQ